MKNVQNHPLDELVRACVLRVPHSRRRSVWHLGPAGLVLRTRIQVWSGQCKRARFEWFSKAHKARMALGSTVNPTPERHVRHAEIAQVLVCLVVIAHAREVDLSRQRHRHASSRALGPFRDARVRRSVDGGEVAAGRAASNLSIVELFRARQIGARRLLDCDGTAVIAAHRRTLFGV